MKNNISKTKNKENEVSEPKTVRVQNTMVGLAEAIARHPECPVSTQEAVWDWKRQQLIFLKNELPELLSAVCNHADCPPWLRHGIVETISEQDQMVIFTVNYFKAEFEAIAADIENVATKTAAQLAAAVHHD